MMPETRVYLVTYVEVRPTAMAEIRARLVRYRETTRTANGNLRCELLQRVGEPHQLVVLETWRDQSAADAHAQGALAKETREAIAAVRNAPTDDRVHAALTVAGAAPPPRGALHVVTHVDVIPPRKDDGAEALRRLADESRRHAGNLRFEVVQQVNRPNHFTVVEAWADAAAFEAHAMAEATRAFRDALAPATGALYDERRYLAVA